jgi:4-amino-4-deoxy-L-arabinose transferase-like glycosyltransferase
MLKEKWQKLSEGRKEWAVILFLIIFTALLYGYRMGALSLTDPDEVFYAQTAKEMLRHHTWSVPYIFGQPQFEKPILFYFLLAIAFKLFGVSAAVARFWPALFGIIGIVLTYLLGRQMYNRRVGIIAALTLATSLEYLALARGVLTDVVFSVLLLGAFYGFYMGYMNVLKRRNWFLSSFAFAALATLTKGPIGIMLPVGVIVLFLALRREIKVFFSREVAQGLLLFALIALPWYIWILKNFGVQFVNEFIIRDNIYRFFFIAEHPGNNTWYYYLTSTLGGFLPWSVFLVIGFFKLPWRQSLVTEDKKGLLFLFCWIAVIFSFFSLAQSKLISYVFPIFPALAIITAGYLNGKISEEENKDKKLSVSFALAVLLLTLAFVSLGAYGLYYNKHHHFLPKGPSTIPLFCLGIPATAAFVLSLCRKYKAALLIILMAIFSLVMVGETWLIKYIDPWVSSRESGEFIKNYLQGQKTTLVCNKFFARGLLYYTDFPIVVMDSSPQPFFAAHPIEVIADDLEVITFFKKHPETFAVVKKGNYKKLRCWPLDLRVKVLYEGNGRYILKGIRLR